MARFTFSINGLIDLEPISFDKVDKFYSTQNEFLRDSSVLTSTSRYSEMLHLATFAFDVSKAEEVNKLSTLIGICRSFPYVFIKSEAIEERHLNPLNLAIGSGYFMYARCKSYGRYFAIIFDVIQPINGSILSIYPHPFCFGRREAVRDIGIARA